MWLILVQRISLTITIIIIIIIVISVIVSGHFMDGQTDAPHF